MKKKLVESCQLNGESDLIEQEKLWKRGVEELLLKDGSLKLVSEKVLEELSLLTKQAGIPLPRENEATSRARRVVKQGGDESRATLAFQDLQSDNRRSWQVDNSQ